jgi:hypothetical protein
MISSLQIASACSWLAMKLMQCETRVLWVRPVASYYLTVHHSFSVDNEMRIM